MKKTKTDNGIVHVAAGLEYFPIENAAVVTVSDTRNVFSNSDAVPIKKIINGKEHNIVPWGANNDFPNLLIPKISKNVNMASNMKFNIDTGYGSGIIPVRVTTKESVGNELNIQYTPVTDNDEINEFFENNNLCKYWWEQNSDAKFFYNVFPELILNQDDPNKRKVVELRSKEAAFSRWGSMNKDGKIDKHYYSAFWTESPVDKTNIDPKNPLDISITDVLDSYNPVLDLKRKIGREPYPDLKKVDDKVFRYIMPINFPTPGRTYYQKAPFMSIIESGWYDYDIMIPEAKTALMNNKMIVNFVVYIHEKYFDWIFQSEGITEDAKKKTRIAKEYSDIKMFLSGAKNQGKAIITKMFYSPEGKEMPAIIIKPVDNPLKGGEYNDDSEEVSNIMAYGMDVHSSLIGSHGKGGTINGTEARELFIIKQAREKPYRDMLLKPLYLIKAINNWPKDIHFIVPNLQLTTLDKGTGAVKQVGGPTV